MRAKMATKRQRLEANQKHTFLQRLNEKFTSKNVEKDLKTSQAACYQLDIECVSICRITECNNTE